MTKSNGLKLTFLKTLEGLRYLHKDLDICYGGLTGKNVLITKEGDVKISKAQFNTMQELADFFCSRYWRDSLQEAER